MRSDLEHLDDVVTHIMELHECAVKMARKLMVMGDKERDVKSAVCIEMEGMRKIPVERRESTLGERLTSTFFDTLMKINGIKVMQVAS